jgi:outer membrane lipoprotein-sorting protein
MMKNEDLIKKLESARLPEAELQTHQRLLKTALLNNYEFASNKTAQAVKRRTIPIMDMIKGVNGNKWLRPVALSLSVVAIVAMLFVLQPWTGNNGYTTILAKAKEAAEDIQSYCLENTYLSISNDDPDDITVISDYVFEFELPDRGHVIYSYSNNSSEGSGELFFIGQDMYYPASNSGSWVPVSSDYEDYVNSVSGTEYAVALMEFLKDLQQLPDEEIDDVTCLHYKGTTKLRDINYEIWIGKDDFLVRQIQNKAEDETKTYVYTTRYYNYNADMNIEAPLDDYGNLLSGWEVKAAIKWYPDLIPVDEALSYLTGDEDWTDPEVVAEAYGIMLKVTNEIVYFTSLPEEAQQAIIEFVEENGVNYGITTAITITQTIIRP